MSNQERYRERFGLGGTNPEKAKNALTHALDIRKFEIDLYWKRATYFWALIAVAFAGFFAILASKDLVDRDLYAYVISVIGFVFTWAWFLVNKGSKFWQENWENHVDMLEDDVTGPLYKTVLHRPANDGFIERCVTGPAKFSVSKINQWVSFFTLIIWITLIIQVLPSFSLCSPISWSRFVVGFFGVSSCVMMVFGGRTYRGPHNHKMKTRKTRIL